MSQDTSPTVIQKIPMQPPTVPYMFPKQPVLQVGELSGPDIRECTLAFQTTVVLLQTTVVLLE